MEGALEIAIEYKLRKEAILAKQGPVDEDAKAPEEIKQEKIVAKHEEYNKPPPPDYRRTFTNLVVKKEDQVKKRGIRTHQSSRRLAPLNFGHEMYGDSSSQMKIIPRLKHPHLRSTMAGKDSVFLTGLDASGAQNESSRYYINQEYPHMDSATYQNSLLAINIEPRRVLDGQMKGMLMSINTKSQKSLANLDSNVESQIKLDLNLLNRENELLGKELNELIYKK